MPVPGYQEFMLPLVKLAADGQEHKITDAIDALADQFGVSEQDREIMLPSGTQTRLYNRVTWALTYLTKSLLLEKSARGRFKIAPRGVDVLKKNLPRIDNAFLTQFDEFRAFRKKRPSPRLLSRRQTTEATTALKLRSRRSSASRAATTSFAKPWPMSCSAGYAP